MHAGLSHLVGNMLFLWAFGIIIEGKLGWWAFTLAYLGIGAAESAGIQLVMRSEHTVHVLGASGAIFGLLAMCLVWAPRNDLQCVFMFRLLPMEFDFPILGFAAFYIGMEVFTIGLTGFAISSPGSHLRRILGFVLATACSS